MHGFDPKVDVMLMPMLNSSVGYRHVSVAHVTLDHLLSLLLLLLLLMLALTADAKLHAHLIACLLFVRVCWWSCDMYSTPLLQQHFIQQFFPTSTAGAC